MMRVIIKVTTIIPEVFVSRSWRCGFYWDNHDDEDNDDNCLLRIIMTKIIMTTIIPEVVVSRSWRCGFRSSEAMSKRSILHLK